MDTYFETERLILRPFTKDDFEDVYQMNTDPEVSKYTGDGGVQSREEIRRRIEGDTMGDYEKYGYGRMAIIHKADQKFLGFAGLKYLDDLKEVDLGYRLIRPYWGQGIATEAARPFLKYGFETLDLEKIIAMVIPENTASSRVLEKLGFSFEKFIMEEGQQVAYYGLKVGDSTFLSF